MSGVVVISPEDLAELVRGAVREEVAKLPIANAKEVMTVHEVAELLNRHWKIVMSELVKKRGLPVHYISAHEPRFLRTEVLRWIAEELPKLPAKKAAGAEGMEG